MTTSSEVPKDSWLKNLGTNMYALYVTLEDGRTLFLGAFSLEVEHLNGRQDKE